MRRTTHWLSLLTVGFAVAWAIGDARSDDSATQKQEPSGDASKQVEFSAYAKALPFPPDARELEFDATFDDITFTSRSSLASLAAFYRKEMAKRGWQEDASAAVVEDDSIELTFKHGGAGVEIELDQWSDEAVEVSMDCEGLEFAGTDDPAGLVALGIPQPRAYLFLQKELLLPKDVRDLEYEGDGCTFKSAMKLQAAFDHFGKQIKAKGYKESRRPIIKDSRRYTEFERGPVTLSVNVFTHEIGSRIVLGYEDEREEASLPPLPKVASAPTKTPAGGSDDPQADRPAQTSKTAINVAGNKGTATVLHGSKKYVFKHVASFRTKDDGSNTTNVVFSSRPIPFGRIQKTIAAKDDFSFGDLYEFYLPNFLVCGWATTSPSRLPLRASALDGESKTQPTT